MIRWDNADGALGEVGTERNNSAVLVDLYPTLVELAGITGGGQKNYMPTDRTIDGISMASLLKDDAVIHTADHPILHMKREVIKAVQYTVTTESVLAREEYKDYKYPVLLENENITFKYFL